MPDFAHTEEEEGQQQLLEALRIPARILVYNAIGRGRSKSDRPRMTRLNQLLVPSVPSVPSVCNDSRPLSREGQPHNIMMCVVLCPNFCLRLSELGTGMSIP